MLAADVAAEPPRPLPEAGACAGQMQEAALPVVVILLLVAGTIADREQFLTRDNMLTVLTQASVTGVVAMGMTFVIATGGIDLSVGSVLAAAADRRRPRRRGAVPAVHGRRHRVRRAARA